MAAEAVDREFVYIEWEDLSHPPFFLILLLSARSDVRDWKNIDFILKSIRKSTDSSAGASGSERQGSAGTEKVSISYENHSENQRFRVPERPGASGTERPGLKNH